jgi:hypothetical protein
LQFGERGGVAYSSNGMAAPGAKCILRAPVFDGSLNRVNDKALGARINPMPEGLLNKGKLLPCSYHNPDFFVDLAAKVNAVALLSVLAKPR